MDSWADIRNRFLAFKREVFFDLCSVNELRVLESFALLNVHAFHERVGCTRWLLLGRFAVVVIFLDDLVRGGYCAN